MKLDADAHYTEVAFPVVGDVPEPICCRIGASQKYELKVGPKQMNNSIASTAEPVSRGLICSSDPAMASRFRVGTMVNSNSQVVFVAKQQRSTRSEANNATILFFMAPTAKDHDIPALNIQRPSPSRTSLPSLIERNIIPPPTQWDPSRGCVVPLGPGEERQSALTAFYNNNPRSHTDCAVVSVDAVQYPAVWKEFARHRAEIAAKHWAVANDADLFHGTGDVDPFRLLHSPQDFYANFVSFSNDPFAANVRPYEQGENKTVVYARVALGRINDSPNELQISSLPYHSVCRRDSTSSTNTNEVRSYRISNPLQAYPAYLITYRAMVPNTDIRLHRPGRNAIGILSAVHRAPLRQTSTTTSLQAQNRRRVVRAHRPSRASIATPAPHRSRFRTNVVPTPVTTPQPPGPSHFPGSAGSHVHRQIFAAAAAAPPPPSTRRTPPVAPFSTPESTCREAAEKQCVICMERPVCKVLVPCGHPCLCNVCSRDEALGQLRQKCPECRQVFTQVIRFFGTVVENNG